MNLGASHIAIEAKKQILLLYPAILAIAMASGPRCLLLDEATSGLDANVSPISGF